MILFQARDEIEYKNKTIYKIHEKLVLKEAACNKIKTELKDFEASSLHSGDRRCGTRCQICMSAISGKNETGCPSCADSETGKLSSTQPQYVSESLIGMSVKKVDNLRARLESLKKMNLSNPSKRGSKFMSKLNCAWSNESCTNNANPSHLRRQIELRGKLYQILQKHADQSCEDFINLLKLTVSNSGGGKNKGLGELKPSNYDMMDEAADCINNFVSEPRFSSNIKITKSFNTISQFFKSCPLNRFDHYNESVILEDEDMDNMCFN